MSEEESFDSFYGRLNKIINAKLNLGEKIKDTKVVKKVLRSLLESFRAKVTAIEESKDLDTINIQELVSSLQTYELGLPCHKRSKSLGFRTINERTDEFSDKDDVEKETAYLAKNFQKFLKMKNNGKSFDKGKSSSFKNDKKDFKKKDYKDSSPSQGIACYECNGHTEYLLILLLKLRMMKKNTLMKVIGSFKLFMMHCLRIVASMPK